MKTDAVRNRGGLTRGAAGALAVAAIAAAAPFAAAASDVSSPTQWPTSEVAAPQIESWTNAIRFSGPNREQTALALALGLRGAGDYPFDTADPSSGGAPTLAAADDWWGVGTCPRAIIVVAGDTPADSLAASALSDPTDNSSEPFLQRSAAADPLFDPIGGFARVDTEAAPIIVTRSTRQGATALGAPARIAARDLRSGGCTLARQAIVVGGAGAVPASVDAELVTLGYDEVFRVSGTNRYATAAAIADALGTGSFVDDGRPCVDPVVNDGAARMGFYANAAVELRSSATSCRVLGRTVVIAEGVTGADALAAGWWTSFWQVPVLLHDGGDSLPPATVGALTTLPIDHVVVLGGVGRIPTAVVDDIAQLTGARVERIAGPDRYATSVAMAQQLGGWWPTGRADEYDGSMVCIAASSGSGATGRGWPDALAAGPWCGAVSSAAAGRGAPVRALAPLTGGHPAATTSPSVRPGHDAVPVLLVPAGATVLPAPVAELLSSAFDPNDSFCSSVQALAGCVTPGFVIAAGGSAVLPSALLADAAEHVAGGSPATGSATPPPLASPILTSLDLSPVYANAPAGAVAVCVPRDGYVESRWLTTRAAASSTSVISEYDAMLAGNFARDADGTQRTPGVGAPVCVAAPGPPAEVVASGVGIAGRVGDSSSFSTLAADRVVLSAPVAVGGPDAASGTSTSDNTSNGGSTTQTYLATSPGPGVVSRGTPATIDSASITITLVRGTDLPGAVGVDRYSAALTVDTPNGTITATSTGEAIFSAGVWHLRGRTDLTGGSWNVTAGSGGFRADLDAGPTSAFTDDSISWQLDAVAD